MHDHGRRLVRIHMALKRLVVLPALRLVRLQQRVVFRELVVISNQRVFVLVHGMKSNAISFTISACAIALFHLEL